MIRSELQTILNWVVKNKYSSFYKDKYDGTVPIFFNAPFLTREEILKVPPFERCFVDKKKIIGVLSSSGTTKYGPLIIPEELRIQRYRGKKTVIYNEVFFKRLIKRGGGRIMALGTSILFNRVNIVPHSNLFIAISDVSNLAMAADTAQKMEIDGLWSNPSSLYFFIPYLKEKYDLSKMLFVSLGSEFCSEEKLKFFKKNFPNALFSFIYGSAEVGTVGWQCDKLSNKTPTVYHFLDFIYPEIINPETEKNTSDGEFGELVLTVTEKRAFVPIRYRTGDRARILNKKCECKDKGKLFEIGGRIGMDDVTIQGAKIVRSEVEKVLSNIEGIELDFKIHIYEKEVKSKFYYYFRLELVGDKKLIGNKKTEDEIARRIEKELKISARLRFIDLIDKQVFLPLDVKIVKNLPKEFKRRNFVLHY